MPFRHFYLLSHYICNGLFFLFSVCWLHVNEFNSFWEELRGRGQEVVAYSDTISTMLNLFSSFTDDKMMPQAITLHDKFIIILSQYIIFSQNVCYMLYITHISQQECRGVLELECTINIKAISVLFCKMTTPFIFTVR